MKSICEKIKRVNLLVPIIFSLELLISYILLGGFEDNSNKQGDIFLFGIFFIIGAILFLNFVLYFLFVFFSKRKLFISINEKLNKIAFSFIITNLWIVSSLAFLFFALIIYAQIMISSELNNLSTN